MEEKLVELEARIALLEEFQKSFEDKVVLDEVVPDPSSSPEPEL